MLGSATSQQTNSVRTVFSTSGGGFGKVRGGQLFRSQGSLRGQPSKQHIAEIDAVPSLKNVAK